MITTVFVYGTLKQGHGNHSLLAGSEFIGPARTVDAYPMAVSGIPYVYRKAGVGHRIKGEVYRVDEGTLAMLDRLEGHPNFYTRHETEVELASGGRILAHLYFIEHLNPWIEESSFFESYEQGLLHQRNQFTKGGWYEI